MTISGQGVTSVKEQSGARFGHGVESGVGLIRRHPIGFEEEEVVNSNQDEEPVKGEEEGPSEETEENRGR